MRNFDIDIAILNLSYFPSEKRISKNIFKILNNYKSNIYVESAPKSFSLLSGVLAENMTKISKVNSKNYFLASRNSPAPANPKGIYNYYTNKNDIIKLVSKIKKRNIKTKKLSFEESVLWPNIRINDLI